jgi:hypothetical protein
MSFDTVAAEIDRILFECDVTKEDLESISIVIPEPSKTVGNKGTKTRKGITVRKYVEFEAKATREKKMEYVLGHIARATSVEFLVDMKKIGWMDINYTRSYKGCIGGPVFLIGIPVTDYSRSLLLGRTRFGELNGKFPIHALTLTCVNKFNDWKILQKHKIELDEAKIANGPSDEELEDLDLDIE